MARLGLEAGAHTADLAVELGVRGVPISADLLVAQGVAATLDPLVERGLQVCQIGAFGYNPLSTDTEAQARQRATLVSAIPLAVDTGCPYIVINGGNYHPSGFGAGDPRNHTAKALDRVAEALLPLLALAERYGARLSIEPYLKTAIDSPESFLALLEKVGGPDALRVNIDVTSFYDYQDMLDPASTVDHVCAALAGHYGLGHLKGLALKDGFHIHIDLAPLTQDPTDWAQVLRRMAPNLPADSWVILEHVASPDEARTSLAHVRQAATLAGVILE